MADKRCARCGETKSTSEFGRDAGRYDGLAIYCLACRRAAYTPRTTELICRGCGVSFLGTGRDAYCTRKCREQARYQRSDGKRQARKRSRLEHARRDCPSCGTNFAPWTLSQTACSKKCSSSLANGNRVMAGADGYVWIRVPEGTPGRYQNGYMPEHRYVMQQKLGRPLAEGENVHHLNGDRSDNREANLELWITKQPKGQHVDDVVEHATEMLRRYAPHLLAEA